MFFMLFMKKRWNRDEINQLNFISNELGFNLSCECKLADIAEEMFKKKIQYIPKDLR